MMIPTTRLYLKTIAGLVAAVGLIVLAIYVAEAMGARSAGARPQAQGLAPGLGPFGTTEENNATAHLESLSYKVDAVGSPRRTDGIPDRTTVIILMPVQSPNFSPDERIVSDPEAQKQLWAAFDAGNRYFPNALDIGAGLTWGGYIFLFPASLSDIAATVAGGGPNSDFWLRVEREALALDARTWQPVYDRNFVGKDFASASGAVQGMPPNDEPALRSDQIRLQPASAYLPDGNNLQFVATVRTVTGQPARGRQVNFAYTLDGGEAQQFASATTGSDGSARATLELPAGVATEGPGGVVMVSVSTADVSAGASVPIQTGPVASEATALDVVSASLGIQGDRVLGMQYPAQGVTGPRPERASVLVSIAAPRFDMKVRGQILTIAGTLLAALPNVTTAEPVMFYRRAGTAFELVFRVERADWNAWLSGSITEAELWNRISLSKIIDAQTGHPADTPDFVSKNFADREEGLSLAVPANVESRLAQEEWGEQLYTGRIRIPVGASAHEFVVGERTPGAEFAIYSSTDPFAPLYSSTTDPSGDTLRALALDAGQYILSLQGGAAPSTVRLNYLEFLMRPNR